MNTRLTTEILGEHPPLLDIEFPSLLALGQNSVSSWVRGGDGLIGFGEYKKFTVTGPGRFADARKWWRTQVNSFDIDNNVHGSGTGPIVFTSFSFDENEESVLVIPEVVIGQKSGKSWITWIGQSSHPVLAKTVDSSEPMALQWSGSNGAQWQDRVAAAINEIKNGQLEKLVLARFIDCATSEEINPRRLMRNLAKDYPSTWIFSNSGLIGATPELLVRLNKSLVTSRILAGTIQKTGDDAKDLALAGSLARSSKDLEEHEYAVRSVGDALAPICSSTNVPETPFVLHLTNVMHLATDVTGVLSDSTNPIDIFDLLTRLHPSAAICGTPTPLAKKMIGQIEGISRGRYAGPIGWIDARGDGELGIALRCGQISYNNRSIRLFAGCGIVAGSDPESEYAESFAKLLPIRTALERH